MEQKKEDITVQPPEIQDLHVTIQVKIDQLNRLGNLLRYQLNKETSFKKRHILNFLIALITAVGATLLYIGPTKKFANDNLAKLIIFELSSVLSNFGITVWAALLTMEEFEPLDLNMLSEIGLDDREIKKEQILQGFKKLTITIISALTSLPYGFASEDAIWIRIVIALANAFTSFVAVNNFFIPDVKRLWHFIFANEQTKTHDLIFAAFAHIVRQVTNEMIVRRAIPNEMYHLEGTELLKFIAQRSSIYNIPTYRPLTTGQIIARRIVPGAIGGGLMLSLSIYALRTHEALAQFPISSNLELTITSLLSGLFLYIAVRIGINTGFNVADLLSGVAKAGLAFRLAPKTTVGGSIAVTAVTGLSFSTIVYFILNDPNFNGGVLTEYRMIAAIFAGIGACIFNTYANLQLLDMVIKFGLKRLGPQASRELINFGEKIEKYLKTVETFMPRKIFMDSIEKVRQNGDQGPKMAVHLVSLPGSTQNLERLIKVAEGNPVPTTRLGRFESALSHYSKKAYDAAMGPFLKYASADDKAQLFNLPLKERIAFAKEKMKTTYGTQVNNDEPLPSLLEDRKQTLREKCWSLLSACPKIRFNFGGKKPNLSEIEEEYKPILGNPGSKG